MMRRIVPAALAVAVLLGACAPVMTGGGWIEGQDGRRAPFAFTYDGPAGLLRGTYEDPGSILHGRLRVKLVAVTYWDDWPGFEDQCMGADGTYESLDRRRPGGGEVRLEVCDGDGESQPDHVFIALETGPFAGYNQGGDVQGGSMTAFESRPDARIRSDCARFSLRGTGAAGDPPLPWAEAKAAAEALPRGHLATISSEAENECVYAVTASDGLTRAWIGASDGDVEGTWVWHEARGRTSAPFWTGTAGSGSPVGDAFTRWAPGEPSDTGPGVEDCAEMWDYFQTYWNDFSCTASIPYVVEIG